MFESPEIYKRFLEWFSKLTVKYIVTLHAASVKSIFTQGATFQNEVDICMANVKLHFRTNEIFTVLYSQIH